MIFKNEDLLGRLKSIKSSFLFEKADYFNHFIESAEKELNKSLNEINKEKIESLIEMSVRTSSLLNDPYHEDISCSMPPYTIQE
jgi:gamma-tubulin complex component 2